MVKKILITLLLIAGMLSLQAQKAGKKSTPVTDELNTRIKMVTDRIVFGDEPKLTEDFLLACVTLDPQFSRRFTEFSGDQCGRYLSAFSRIQIPGNPVDLGNLARKIALAQRSDGRFGNDTLNFSNPLKLSGLHMALLWGNGRLLTGLMDYYAVSKDPIILQSAKKLGDFMLKVTLSCTKKEVVDSFKTKGAMGYICFTQIIDGLVKLYEQTSDRKYLENAVTIYPLLPPLGNQHSHGFLNTLLGVMRLYQVTKDTTHLHYVERIYQKVLKAPDFLISGGVPEFFDSKGPKKGSRDEGCSEADFVMVSLELWKATGKMEYLERAEYCLYNELMYNQFDSGDFGSHPISQNFGFELATSQGRCWWCCDYHGLQAMLEASNIIVTPKLGRKLINLYAYTKFRDSDLAFTLKKESKNSSSFALQIDSCGHAAIPLAFRIPGWASKTTLLLNGKAIEGKAENGYLIVDQNWKKGDRISIFFDYRLKLTTLKRHTYSLEEFPDTLLRAAIQYGPYLLCVDDVTGNSFLAEPSARNVIYLPAKGVERPSQEIPLAPIGSNVSEAYLRMNYKHEGYYTIGKVTMRPMSEASYGHQGIVQLWFNFLKK